MEISDGEIRAIVMGFSFLFSGAEAADVAVTMTLMTTATYNWVAVIFLSVDILTSASEYEQDFCFYILFSHLISFSFLSLIFCSIWVGNLKTV